MGWTPEQEQCITCHGGTLLVSAAAGSGKTSVLVERIIQRVTDAVCPIDLDRLLVVTFTNAAAAEMRHRLSERLTQAVAESPDDLRLQRQLLMLPRADICTVDSFCIGLLREHFHALELSPQFKVADEQQAFLLRNEALNEALQTCYAEQDPAFEALAAALTNGKTDARLYSAAETVFRFIQSYPDPDEWLTDTAALYDASVPIADTVWGRCVLDEIRAVLRQCESLYVTACTAAEQDEVLQNAYAPSLLADLTAVRELETCAENGDWDRLFAVLSAFTPAGFKGSKGADPALKARCSALRDKAKKSLEKLTALGCGTAQQCRDDLTRSAALIGALYTLVRRFSENFAVKKRAADLIDFSDAEHMALSLLTRKENKKRVPSALAQELSAHYDEILVDEYQDTNAVQDALFLSLSRHAENLFFVGDVKQSIYAFRKAMPKLFIDKRNAYPPFDGKHYPATITLGKNFRSRLSVTSAVNFLFRQLMIPQVGGITYDENEQLVCGATYPNAEGEPYRTECLIVDGTTFDKTAFAKDQAEALVIAERIAALKGNFTVTEKGVSRPLTYGDCCILLRSHKSHAAAYREALSLYGIPSVAAVENGFFETAEIRIALSLLRCIDNPLQDVPLTAVMLSPLFGFSTDDLAEIRLCRRDAALYHAVCTARKQAADPLKKRCAVLVDTLRRYRDLAALLTVDRLLNRLYEELAIPEILCARFGGTIRADNLQLLYDQCTQFEQAGFRGLSSFIRHIDRLQEQQVNLSGAAPHAGEDAVQIISVHASKGLEYPVVFLAGLGNEFNRENAKADLLLHTEYGVGMTHRDPVSYTRRHTLPWQGLLLMQRADDRAEELRILYVAMTRAREKLYLVTTVSDPAKRLSALGALIDPACETLSPSVIVDADSMSDWVLTALLRHPCAAALRQHAGLTEEAVLPDAQHIDISFCTPAPPPSLSVRTQTAAEPDETLMQRIRDNMAYDYPHRALAAIPSKMAASELTADPTRPELVAHTRPAFLSRGGLTPSERGTAMHTFMQFADYAAAAESIDREADRLVALGFLSADAAASLDRHRLRGFFESDLYARMCRAERVLREYHFTYCEDTAYGEEVTVIQGIADCVFVEDGALVIVDYKTDRVHTPEELIDRYEAQLRVYARALNTVLELPVRECLLYSFALNRSIPLL
ncbi:MAG: helicase-exonuclease AddAB subunit AddA [Clostridia bacterium]|nr:helicase-exonuclease AddAB subunit AddA [Clostridia bacterium]